METNSTKQELIESITSIVGNDRNISYLKNNICYGTFLTKKGFTSEFGVNFNSCWIRLVRISKVNMRKFFEWKSNSYHYSSSALDSSGYFSIFSIKSRSRSRYNNLFYMGCNIDKDLPLSGYCYNITDIYNSYYMEHNTSASSQDYSSYIYKYLFIGNKNFLIGFIDKDCILYLDYNLLETIKMVNNDKYVEVVRKIFSVYSIVNMAFFDGNVSGLESQILDHFLKKYIKTARTAASDITYIKPDELDIFSDDDTSEKIITKLVSNIKTEIKLLFESTSWGVDNQYSYNRIISDIIKSRDTNHKYEVEKAFTNGLIYGNKFELCGWSICDNFAYSDDIAWKKEVNIIPSRVVYDGKLYNINNNDQSWQNPYKITNIYVTINGKMWCDGNHPNVLSGQVCMGDISQKITLGDPATLGENLNKCEALLTLINYDSAYTSENREWILKHSTLDITNTAEIDTEYVGNNEILTDISFENEDDQEQVEGCEEVSDGNVEGIENG